MWADCQADCPWPVYLAACMVVSQPRLSRLPSPGVRATACTAVVARHARPSLDRRRWRVLQPRSSGRVASGRATYTPQTGRRQGGETVGSGGGIWPRGLRRRRSRQAPSRHGRKFGIASAWARSTLTSARPSMHSAVQWYGPRSQTAHSRRIQTVATSGDGLFGIARRSCHAHLESRLRLGRRDPRRRGLPGPLVRHRYRRHGEQLDARHRRQVQPARDLSQAELTTSEGPAPDERCGPFTGVRGMGGRTLEDAARGPWCRAARWTILRVQRADTNDPESPGRGARCFRRPGRATGVRPGRGTPHAEEVTPCSI